jgi:hypothetical protein
VYKETPRDCYGCHKTDYDATQNPNHASSGFPTSCQNCHKASDTSWNRGVFNHDTVFPLVGLHATAPCSACHKNNQYAGTPRNCYGCHKAEYDQTTNPNHLSAGFPTGCESCHKASDTSWNQGIFNHDSYFRLVGLHATAPCSACHKNNQYAGTPRTCYGCHKAEYDQTTDPNHTSAGFPTTCDTCHKPTDTSWNQGTFNHSWFPITTGKHSGYPCSACHKDPGNYRSFTCLSCHTRSETDPKHQNVSGYVYDSNACYSCHPTGSD